MTASAQPTPESASGRSWLDPIKSVARTGRRIAAATYRQVRDSIDQRLHDRRRSRSLTRLRTRPPQSVLMICLGNICRSPFAEFALQRALPGHGVKIQSAGFIGPDRSSPERAQAAALEFGIDLGPHRSKLITTKMLREHDLIVVMETGQRTKLMVDHRVPDDQILLLGDLDPQPIDTRTILDPYAGSPDDFRRCYERVQRCIDTLASVLADAAPRA